MYLYIFLYGVFVYLSDQIALNYVVCIYFASPGASHLLNFKVIGLTRLGIKPEFIATEACTLTTQPSELSERQ